MREHYKDDWLKALQADQGRLPENKAEEQSEPREITADEVKNEERVTVTVTEESKNGENKGENEVENDQNDQKQKNNHSGKYCKDPLDRYVWANSADPDQTAPDQGLHCLQFCIVWTHYSMVEPHSSNFRVITTNFSGVRIFRKFMVDTLKL